MEEQKKDKKILLSLKPRLVEMLQQIIEQTGATGNQDAIRRSITAYHKQVFPAYSQRTPSQRLNRTPEERARDIIEQKKSLEDQKKQDQLELAARLNGEIKGNSVTYRTFTKKYGTKIHEGSSTVALDLLTEDHINNQFQNTTKEECEAQGIVF